MFAKMEALIEFKRISKNEVYTISKIKQWLLKYVGNYYELKSNWTCSNSNCSYRVTKFCSCNKKDDAYVFMELFNTLMSFSKYHQKEQYAKLELESYRKIKDDDRLLKKWVIKNEYVGAIDCFELLLCHYDYDLNPYNLLVLGQSLLGYEVFVDRKDFKNLIKFLEIFNNLFWIKRVYPESNIL